MRSFVYALLIALLSPTRALLPIILALPSGEERGKTLRILERMVPASPDGPTSLSGLFAEDALHEAEKIYLSTCLDGALIKSRNGFILTVAKLKLLNIVRDEAVRGRAARTAAVIPGFWINTVQSESRALKHYGQLLASDTAFVVNRLGADLVEQLDLRHIKILYDRYVDELTLPKIAETEGIRLSTAQSQLRTAERVLTKIIKDTEPMLQSHGWFGSEFWKQTGAVVLSIIEALAYCLVVIFAVSVLAVATDGIQYVLHYLFDDEARSTQTDNAMTPAAIHAYRKVAVPHPRAMNA